MPAQYLAIGFKGTGRHRKGRFFAPLFDYAFGPSTSVDPNDGRYVRLSKVAKCVFSSTVMLMKGGYCRLKNLTHRNSQTLAALCLATITSCYALHP